MAPEDNNVTLTPAPEPSPVAAAVETPVVTETLETLETLATLEAAVEAKPVETPVVAEPALLSPEPKPDEIAAKPVEAKPVDAKPVETVKVETPADKPADAKPEVKVDEKPAEVATETPVDVTPVYDPIKLPDDVKLPAERLTEIDSMFGNFEKISKADHAQTAQFRQAFVEYGVGVVKDALAEQAKQASEYWAGKEKEWKDQFEKDPEYGGNRKETTLAAAKQFIATHVGTPEQQKEFYQLLNDHKLANHPVMIRALANANLARSEGRPLPGTKPVPMPTSKLDKWYGKS